MNTFVRSYRKCGFRPQMVLPSKKYSSTHYRSHFALKYRIDPNGPAFVASRHNLLSTYRYLPAVAATASHDYHTLTYNSNCYQRGDAYSFNTQRYFRLGQGLYEQPSSKVEVTVQNMKDKQKEKVEEIIKEATAAAGSTVGDNKVVDATAKPVVVKKSLKTRIWEECLHYYHGFRLLFIDINICRKLLWRVLNGKTLSRRENKLLVRTTSDLFRLIPFSVFILVPFLELTLPFFIKFFPGMLPSTFQTTKEREDKLKTALHVRLEMAKFLQKTLDEMSVQHKEHRSEDAKQFELFFKKIRNTNELVSSDDIIKFAKRFNDEITLDFLSREQLVALCRVLELNTMGTTKLLRFQLRLKLRSLAADDRVIAREGVNSLDLWELQQASKARGMRAYGLTKERMQTQLQEWIDLSLNEKVPPTLLLLSRAVSISDDSITTDKLKETLRVLPDSLANQTKAAIGESEGKIDNKVKLEIIKEEVRKIQEEHEEEREEAKAKAEKDVQLDKAKLIENISAELIDRAHLVTCNVPPIDRVKTIVSTVLTEAQTLKEDAAVKAKEDDAKSLSSKDVELLSEALKTLSNDKKMCIEKETIKDLKEELEEYKEDVEELHEVRQVVKEPVKESRAAKMLFKKVNNMIGQLDKVLTDLEEKQKSNTVLGLTKEQLTKEQEEAKRREQEIVQIDDLVKTIKKLKQTSDESRLKQIENVLSKLDADNDGAISVDEVLKVVEAIGRENVKLDEKQLEELITLLDKEQILENEEKIEKALAKSMKEAEEAKKLAGEPLRNVCDMDRGDCGKQRRGAPYTEDLLDCAKPIKENALNLDEIDKKNVFNTESSTPSKQDKAILEAAEKQKEKILPKADISSALPPTLPPTSKTVPGNNKEKMI